MRQRNIAVIRLLAVSAVMLGAMAADLPLGHPDFIPSPERPVGWRGDGTGCYPEADPAPDWDLKSGWNVVWHVPMPFFSASGPIVVGDKVFTTAEPDLLICVEAETGKELWRQHGAVFMESLPKPERERLYAAVAEIYDATDAWCRFPAAYQGKMDVQYGNAVSTLWLPGDGGRKTPEDQEAFRKQILELGAERTIDIARIRALYQEVGLIRDKNLRTIPLATPDNRCLMSDLWCGSTAATPVSDGTIVIQKVQNFRFGGNRWGYLNGYTMDGKRLWSVEIGVSGTWDYTYDSPLLVEGVAVAQGWDPNPKKRDDRVLYGIDAVSGKILWTAPIKGGTCSPVRFQVDGETLVYFDSQIFRPKDGKQVCDFRDYSAMNFDTPCFDGLLMFERGNEGAQFKANAGVRGRACVSHVLKFSWAKKPEQLAYEQVWRASTDQKWDLMSNWIRGSSIFRDGWVFFADKGVSMFAYNTAGAPYARGMQVNWSPPNDQIVRYGDAKFGEPAENDMSAVMGGNLVFGCQTNWPVSQFTVITGPPKITIVGAPLAGGPVMGSPCFQGERMYMRGYRYLTCIAKSKKYHSPKGAK